MRKKLHLTVHHGIDFLILLIIIGLGFGGLIFFRNQLTTQISVSIIMSVLYVIWGVVHHHHENNLTLEVVLEYIAMAALVAFILIIFLLRV